MQPSQRGGQSEVIVKAVDAKLVHENGRGFAEEVASLLDQGATKVVLDFSRLAYISSWGVGTLAAIHSKFKKKGALVKLAALQSPIKIMLSIVGFDQLFEVFDTVEEAAASFEVN
jgi:anti-anti-sigma factor